jgi:regulatory protein
MGRMMNPGKNTRERMESENTREYERAWDKAVGLLTRRGHTARELESKLRTRGFDSQTVEAVVSECEKRNFIDDKETGRIYLKELVRKGYGPHRIRCTMQRKGLSETIIDELFQDIALEDMERELCLKALERKMRTTSLNADPLKQKAQLYRHLVSRGFTGSLVCELLGDCPF